MSCSIASAVVPTLHLCHHAPVCSLRIHQPLPLPTAKRQASPPHLLLHRHGSVLLHLRRRRVRAPNLLFKDPALNMPYSRDARRIWFWRHANLIFTAVVCFFIGGFVSEIVQSMLPVRPLITPRSRSLMLRQHKHFDFGDVVVCASRQPRNVSAYNLASLGQCRRLDSRPLHVLSYRETLSFEERSKNRPRSVSPFLI